MLRGHPNDLHLHEGYMGLCRDNGRENANYNRIIDYIGNIGVI